MAANLRESEDDKENTMKILVATDIHLGYAEKDPVRGNDSQNSFEEILKLAKDNEVDFVLLGGDLFHENKPSRRSLHFALTQLRRYCMGDKPCPIEFLSDQSVNFGHCPFPAVNYEDPNVNVSIPVFSIHGNHDDPAGQGGLCSLDLLSASGFINYFGKYSSLEKIEVSPLLLKKGTTRLALYGIGSIRDERMHRMFLHKQVKMFVPRENKDEWFNCLVLHQNRARHGQTNYIPESFLDSFLDLVIWGHEHECRIDPEWNSVQNFYVSQPGSSIATSISEGETKEKHVGLLLIKGKTFKMLKLKLETVRPMLIEEIVLADTHLKPSDVNLTKKMEAYCTEKVEALIAQAEQKRLGNANTPSKPLIRLKVDYSGGFELFNVHRFGQKFVDKIANPRELVVFHRKRQQQLDEAAAGAADLDIKFKVEGVGLDTRNVGDMVREYFAKQDKEHQLRLLTERGLAEAVEYFVDKGETAAVTELVDRQLKKTQEELKRRNVKEEDIERTLSQIKEHRKKADDDKDIEEAMMEARKKRQPDGEEPAAEEEANDGEGLRASDDEGNSTSTRGKGRGRGRGRGKGKAETSAAEKGTKSPRGRGRGGGRGKKAAVVEEATSSIRDHFSQQASRSAAPSFRGNSVKRPTVDDSDNEDTEIVAETESPNRSWSNSRSSQSAMKRGVQFSDDSDSDIRPTKSKTKRK